MLFVPERLKEIRIMNGLTVADMAGLLGITKQAVSKYEMGRMLPSTQILDKIVEVFSLPNGYLTKEPIVPQYTTEVFYRKTKRTTQRELEMVRISQRWRYEMILGCTNISEMLHSEVPYFLSDCTAAEAAKEVRKQWGLDDRPIEDMSALLEKHHFYIFSSQMADSKIDGYSQMTDGYGIIVLNAARGSLERKNFSLAHELGHLLLHTKEYSTENMEEEADIFAGSLLMPEAAFKREILRVDVEQLIRLGERWRVSPHAVLKRCCELGVLSEKKKEERDAHLEYLYQRLNKLGSHYQQEAKVACSLRKVLEEAERDEKKGQKLLQTVRFPIKEIQKLCQMPELFQDFITIEKSEAIDEMEGIQLSFLL